VIGIGAAVVNAISLKPMDGISVRQDAVALR
jgi:hypothetical protein